MTRCVVVCAGRVDFGRICHRGGDGAQRGRSGGFCWSVQGTSNLVATVVEARLECLSVGFWSYLMGQRRCSWYTET